MNVIFDPILSVKQVGKLRRVALPELIATLIVGPEIDAFPRLAADQRGYWWRFMVRCATKALRTQSVDVSEASDLDADELTTRIREALLEHTEPSDWDLHQSDPALPGFLQCPTPSGVGPEEEGYKRSNGALLTAIIGTKEHERKSQAQRVLGPEEAVYALVEYQGGVIFGGRSNYESQLTGSRSGAGSGTPFMGAWIDHSHQATFRHDVSVMLDRWDQVRRERGLHGPVWALWTEPWDGATALPAHRLDPAFIPFARMVRLGPPLDGEFDTVWFLGSQSSRVNDHTEGGHLGDPFTPLVPATGGHLKVRGTLEAGYHYREVVRLMLPQDQEDAVRSPSVDAALSSPPAKATDIRVIFEGMAFEQGKTRGFHTRTVRLPLRAVRRGLFGFDAEPIHAAHQQMLEDTGAVTRRALQSMMALILTGEPRATEEARRKMHAVLQRFDAEVDRVYLDQLFAAAELVAEGVEDWEQPYRSWLFELAVGQILPFALSSLPRSQGRRMEEEVRAEAYLRGRLRRELKLPRPQVQSQTTEAA
jgi:hypothetical protein